MKSDRRHELMENELAKRLAKGIQAVRPYLTVGVSVVVAAAVIWAVWTYVSNRGEANRGKAQADFFAILDNLQNPRARSLARNESDLANLADEYKETPVEIFARFSLAEFQRAAGQDELPRSKSDARDRLTGAIDNYQKVLKALENDSARAFLAQRALYGLGLSHETLEAATPALQSTSELDKAVQAYKQLVEQWPDSAYAKAAKNRLDDLAKPKTREFYAWYRTAQPATASDPFRTRRDSPTSPETDLSDLPSNPDLTLPKSINERLRK